MASSKTKPIPLGEMFVISAKRGSTARGFARARLRVTVRGKAGPGSLIGTLRRFPPATELCDSESPNSEEKVQPIE